MRDILYQENYLDVFVGLYRNEDGVYELYSKAKEWGQPPMLNYHGFFEDLLDAKVAYVNQKNYICHERTGKTREVGELFSQLESFLLAPDDSDRSTTLSMADVAECLADNNDYDSIW